MAEIAGNLRPTHKPNHTLESLFAALDPKSLILAQNSSSSQPENQIMQRGTRYKVYAELRESQLRMKNKQQQSHEQESILTPPKKRVTFQGTQSVTGHTGTSSIVARSVPDFSAALRKENRKPASTLPSMLEMTPPPANSKVVKGVMGSKLGGSKSASAGEKRGGGVMVRKSYASVELLRGLSSTAASAINGENRGGGRSSRGINKTVLNHRKY